MTWYGIIATIRKLTELDEFTVTSCANALECKFERSTVSNRFHSDALHEPFEYAELIFGSGRVKISLKLKIESAREEYALRMLSLGKPIDIDMVSPPMADENGSSIKLDWERKYSLCYEIGDHPVWFGIEEINSRKKLVSVVMER